MYLKRKFSMELQRTISSIKAFQRIQNYEKFENLSTTYFNSSPIWCNKKKRVLKQCYIYFLIDPRISRNLPIRAKENGLNERVIWQQFLNAIFYVGKAKSTRPYSHLYKAINKLNKQAELLNENENSIQTTKFSKADRIIDIWKSGFGVVNLHVFHNISSYEAYTREAAIIDAISLPNLTNQKRGVYYGPSSKWTANGKKSLGIALLYRAMKIFMTEGEAQLFPCDFD
ncbi:ankyrin repeat and LEM domain-containing protein 1 isoform X1 [Zeugodacus cucurbitae]|uniref:ankyrin repeat and LEM domain-containing protein 1 isoform X1 n=1 Tax=Zeugodacus cucurbitae TaxID=28588 RepID=UPI0010A74E90|nr:ankyrin repeat and LEM domain-containing protein 1 isoform X1 [Zeugodacus cucurbitae]